MTEPSKKRPTREDIAMEEIGSTDFAPGVKGFLFAALLAAIVLTPLAANLMNGGKPVMDLLAIPPSPAEAGKIAAAAPTAWSAVVGVNDELLARMRRAEDAVKEESPLKKRAVPWTRYVLAKFFRGGGEDAYVGPGYRMFFRPDVDYASAAGFLERPALGRRAAQGIAHPDPVPAIIDFRDQLAKRGIGLALFPIPMKSSVGLDGTAREPVDNPGMPGFLERMEKEGVPAFYPVREIFDLDRGGVPAYLRGDSHWTPEGMAVAAEGLASFLRENFDLPAGDASLVLRESPVENYGDLVNMLALPGGESLSPKQRVVPMAVTDGNGAPWKPDRRAPVLLLGDSFANIYSDPQLGWGEGAGLAARLSRELGLPVDAVAKNAGGSSSTRQDLAREIGSGQSDRLAGKKVVVWSFAAHSLAWGDWPLYDISSPASSPASGTASGARTVRVRITETSPVPNPDLPYADALTVASAETLENPPETILLQGWAMRDRAVLPMAHWRPGQELTVSIVPLPEKLGEEPGLETVQVIHGVEDMTSPLFWTDGEAGAGAPGESGG